MYGFVAFPPGQDPKPYWAYAGLNHSGREKYVARCSCGWYWAAASKSSSYRKSVKCHLNKVVSYLKQVSVWELSNRCPLSHIRRQVEDCIAIVMLANLNEIVGSGIGKQVNPLLGIPGRSSKILYEIIVYMIRSVSFQAVLVCFFWCVWPQILVPPVPVGRQLCEDVKAK